MWYVDNTESQSDTESDVDFSTNLEEVMPRAREQARVSPLALKLQDEKQGVMLFGTVPPPLKIQDMKKVKTIAEFVAKDIKSINPDGIVVYDIQDEPSRSGEDRPFPFFQTHEPRMYAQMLQDMTNVSPIVFRALQPGETAEKFTQWLNDTCSPPYDLSNFVVVGARESKITVPEAGNIIKQVQRNTTVGGILIAERHRDRQDEV